MVLSEILIETEKEVGQNEPSTLADILFQKAIVQLIRTEQTPHDDCTDGLRIYPVPIDQGVIYQSTKKH